MIRVAFIHPSPTIHFAYQEMIAHPPRGVRFTNAAEFKKDYEARSVRERSRWESVRNQLGKAPIPTYVRISDKHKGADILYVSQAIPVTDKPWVLDLEIPTSLTRFHQRSFDTWINRALLKRALTQDTCVAVTTWSERARKALVRAIPEIREKTFTIPPTIAVPRAAMERKTGTVEKSIDLLFVGIDFERKGGVEAMLAFKRLRKRFPRLTMTMVARIPERYKSDIPRGVTVIERMPREGLYKSILPKARIFILPTFQDTYGLAMVEAMAFGIPIITLEDYATPEIVEDGVTGFVLPGYKERWFDSSGMMEKRHADIYAVMRHHTAAERRRIVDAIVRKTASLLDDEGLLRRMGDAARARVTTGALSMRSRNEKLREIFQRAQAMSRRRD